MKKGRKEEWKAKRKAKRKAEWKDTCLWESISAWAAAWAVGMSGGSDSSGTEKDDILSVLLHKALINYLICKGKKPY